MTEYRERQKIDKSLKLSYLEVRFKESEAVEFEGRAGLSYREIVEEMNKDVRML